MQTYIKEDERKGRCLYANCDISRGTVIKIEEPVVLTVTNENISKYCYYCLSFDKNLKRCRKCKVVYYCSKECEKSDAYQHHYECKSFSNGSVYNLKYYFSNFLLMLIIFVE